MVICTECEKKIDNNERVIEVSGEVYCEECVDYLCDRCGQNCSADDSHSVYDRGDKIWCQTCIDSHSFYCDWCGDSFDFRHSISYCGTYVCEYCAEENGTYCTE